MKLVLVGGMHRSGTSLIAEIVHNLGAETGDDLLEAAPDNPHGFWESRQVKKINDDLLARLGGSWDRPPRRLTSRWFASGGLDRLRRDAHEVVAARLDEASQAAAYVFKDPRFSLTAAFWSSFLTPSTSLVALRDPRRVAESIQHRNGMSTGRAAALWLDYTLGAISDLPRSVIVTLEELVAEPESRVVELAEALDLEGGLDVAIGLVRGRSRTLQPDDIFGVDENDANLRLALAVYNLISGAADVDAVRPAVVYLREAWANHQSATEFHEHIDHGRRAAIEELRDRLGELREQLENERLTTGDISAERDQIRREHRAAGQRLEGVQEAMTAKVEELDGLREAMTAKVEELDGLREARRLEVETLMRRQEEITGQRDAAVWERDQVVEERGRAREERDRAVADREALTQEFEREAERWQMTESSLSEQLGEARTQLAKLKDQLARVTADRDRMSKRAKTAERQFERLKSRRSVRQALRVAGVFRPAFRSVRSVRRVVVRPSNRPSSSQREEPGASPAAKRPPAERSPAPAVDGARSVKGFETEIGSPGFLEPMDASPHREWSRIVGRLLLAPPPTVVVPVHNAAVETERCLSSLIEWTSDDVEILVIDDASTDDRIPDLLRRVGVDRNVKVIRNEENLGFTRTVNLGFDSCDGDVVILNSDARVGPNWLLNLRVAAYSGDRVASSSATSDNAGAFSMPEPGRNESTGLDGDDISRLYTQHSLRLWPEAPTGHGFCMYLRREALEEVGGFDATVFPRGYGEENDWSMRASAKGWKHVVDDATMVLHDNAASFDPEAKEELVARARERVNALHTEYTSRVREFMSRDIVPARQQSERLTALAKSLAQDDAHGPRVRPRLLSIVQEGRGGTPKTNLDLMAALEASWDPFILTSAGKTQRLFQVVAGEPVLVEESKPSAELGFNVESDPVYREFVAKVVLSRGFELVHVRHLFKHTPRDLPDVLRAAGIPAVLSFHDFFWVCPNVHLLDENAEFCGGACTPGQGDCDAPVPGPQLRTRLKHEGVHRWRSSTREVLASFDEFVTTSNFAREILTTSYPELEHTGIEVVPHGRDLDGQASLASAPDPDRVRIVVLGNLSLPKGGGFLRDVLAADVDERLDVHILGGCESEYEDLRCTFHGRYQRDDLAEKLALIRPAFAALLSIWPETWSHTLTEAWAVGVPALVLSKGGALAERVAEHGGGWVLDGDDPAAACAEILRVSKSGEEWSREAALASVKHLTSTAEMADRYQQIYASARRKRRDTRRALVDVRTVKDDFGRSPGSAHVRSLRRFAHPSVRAEVLAVSRSSVRPEGLGPPDVIWVQRNAVPRDQIARLLRDRDRFGARLVVDLDDDLLDPEGLPDEFADYVPAMRELVVAADLVTVSTSALADLVADVQGRVVVLPNQLDETLWNLRAMPVVRQDVGHLDALYMGTATHGGDLELLREPLERYNADAARSIRLHVVGVTATDGDWYERIAVPDGSKEYPAFVRWLESIAGDFDFGVAPLRDTRFNTSKSDLKFLEYAALGLPAVLSESAAYSGTVTDDSNGLLVGEQPEAWLDAFHRIADADTRRRLAEGAIETARHRTIGNTGDEFVRLLTGTPL